MCAFTACTFNRIRADIRARTHTIGGIAKWLMRRSRKAEVPSSNPGFAYFFYFFHFLCSIFEWLYVFSQIKPDFHKAGILLQVRQSSYRTSVFRFFVQSTNSPKHRLGNLKATRGQTLQASLVIWPQNTFSKHNDYFNRNLQD